MILRWFGGNIGLLHERTMMGTGFLAQASLSRLGEINKGSPKLLHANGRSGSPKLLSPFMVLENLRCMQLKSLEN